MLTIHNIQKIYGMGLMPDLIWQEQTDWTSHPHIWIGHPKTETNQYLIPIMGRTPDGMTSEQWGSITIWREIRPESTISVEYELDPSHIHTESYPINRLRPETILHAVSGRLWLRTPTAIGLLPF